MFKIFTYFADWCILKMGLDINTNLGASVHFFIEDITKIFLLVYLLIFVISLFRSQISPEKAREYLSGKKRWYGYILATFLGIITPFCSCSSIPLFIGFLSAGIPFGITMAFLISSPLVSEIATVLLIGMEGAGLKIAVIYVIIGSVIAVIGGFLADFFHLERLSIYKVNIIKIPQSEHTTAKEKIIELIKYAHYFAWDMIKSIGLYIFIGLLIGAIIHGFVPQEFLLKYLGKENLLAVPFAAVIGIPMYANHVGVIPIIQALLLKGVPVGTSLVLLMSITAISLPEMIMLKKVLSWKMIAIFTVYLLISFIIVGYLLNFII
jgi:hypothetical protein